MVTDQMLPASERAVLHFADGAGLDGFEWLKQERRALAEARSKWRSWPPGSITATYW